MSYPPYHTEVLDIFSDEAGQGPHWPWTLNTAARLPPTLIYCPTSMKHNHLIFMHHDSNANLVS